MSRSRPVARRRAPTSASPVIRRRARGGLSIFPSMAELTPDDIGPSSLQQQVDELADDLLARGIPPTPRLLERKLTVPRRRLVDALERWARRLGDDQAAMDSRKTAGVATRPVSRLAPATRLERLAMAALMASRVAASLRENKQRLTRRAELLTEIERGRS